MPTDGFVYILLNDQNNPGERGVMIPKFELDWDFCTMQLPTKFHHPTFNRSEVIMLTNKHTNKQTNPQTDATENIHLTPVEKMQKQISRLENITH